MKGNIEEQACELVAYIIKNHTTVRNAVKKFGIRKAPYIWIYRNRTV